MEQMFSWVVILVITIGMVGLTIFLYQRFQEKRWVKYIPTLIGLVVIFYYFIKIQMPSEGFQDIIYILMLILTGVTTSITLLVAILLDIVLMVKKKQDK